MTKITSETFQYIESAAHTGAFGDNQLATPTDAQTIAGNYRLGRAVIYELSVAIEQPRHSYRTGLDKNGKRWTSRLAAHYGYFSKTKGADGDPVDCFIGFYPQSKYAYVINQHVAGIFDETKVMLCYPDEDSARLAYLQSYDKGWNGLHSITKASISQLKWWLKNGNHKKPLLLNHLPYEGLETMNQKIYWDSTVQPEGMTLDKLLYEIRRADGGDNLLLDSVCMQDILDSADSILAFDALVTPYAQLERKMDILQKVMNRMGGSIKVEAMQISDPFKQSGVAQVAVIFELSDGQTVSIFFHNPDVDPRKIQQSDELISWKWLLNKKDITIVVAPEKGADLNPRVVAERIMKLAEKNSPAFIRANSKRAEKMQAIEDIKVEITGLEQELKDVQHELEVAKVEAENNPFKGDDEVDKAAIANINAATISAALKKKAIKYLNENPGSHKITGLSARSLAVIMENIKAALFAEVLALSPLFKRIGDDNLNLTIADDYLQIAIFKQKTAETGYKMTFYGGNDISAENYLDSTSTVESLRAWGFALPFDLDVKAFVANVVKPVVDKLLSNNEQTNEQAEVTPEAEAAGTEGGVVADIAIPVPELPQGLTANEDDLNTEEERGAREDYLAINKKDFLDFREVHRFQPNGFSVDEFVGLDDDMNSYHSEEEEEYLEYVQENDPLFKFALTAFTVEKEVEAYGGTVAWGDFDASAYTGELFDSAAYGDDFVYDSVVTPGGIVGQIADKIGMVVARVRIEENGVLTLLTGANGTEQAASPTAVVSKIHGAVATVFGGVENRLKEPNLGLEVGPGSAEKVDPDLDPNIGRKWNSQYGRQKIIDFEPGQIGGGSYTVQTIGKKEIRKYYANSIEETIKDNEYHLTPEYTKEVEERKELDKLRVERDERLRIADENRDAEISEFTKGMNPINAEKARLALIKQVSVKGQFTNRKAWMEDAIANGYTIVNVGVINPDEWEGKAPKSGERRLQAVDGSFFDERDITKTGMDYVEYLVSKKGVSDISDTKPVVDDEAQDTGHEPAVNDRFSPGDIVYMEDITDANKRIPVNFRGYVDADKSMVVWNGSQMQIETNRLFKDDLVAPEPTKPAPAITGNPETEKQKAKLSGLQRLQEQMKSANKILKNAKLTDEQKQAALTDLGYSEAEVYKLMRPDFAGRTGFSYHLTNNNAVISSTQKRISQLEAQELAESQAASGDRETSYDFDGGTIDLDYGDDRLRVNFDSKPGPDMIAKLKQNGFKWSPTNTAWQRQLTDNAISTANYLFSTNIKTAAAAMNEEVNKPRGDVIVPAATETLTNPIKAGFEAELKALTLATDIHTLDQQLDDIMERIEAAGLSDALDAPLRDALARMTYLLAEAENKAA